MVLTLERTRQFNRHPSPFEQAILLECHKIELGCLWILQAIAINEINQRSLTSLDILDSKLISTMLRRHISRLSEIHQQLSTAKELQVLISGVIRHRDGIRKRPVYTSRKLPPFIRQEQIVITFMKSQFIDVLKESLEARAAIEECDIVMVAGQQGVGKGVVTAALQQEGFTILSMSEIVKEVAYAWNLDETRTIDKIITGQILKEYFGLDVLVQLGIHYLAGIGVRKIVIDGPRVMEEAQAVLHLGGKLIGVIADVDEQTDRNIRRQRIVERATLDTSRAGDISRFDEREAIEHNQIQQILKLISSPNILTNKDQSPDFLNKSLQMMTSKR